LVFTYDLTQHLLTSVLFLVQGQVLFFKKLTKSKNLLLNHNLSSEGQKQAPKTFFSQNQSIYVFSRVKRIVLFSVGH